MSTDGKTLATVATDRTIRIWDLLARREVFLLATDESAFFITLSGNGKRLACPQLKGGGMGDYMRLVDATTGKELRRLTASDTFSTDSAAFSPDGNALVRRCGAVLEQWDAVCGTRIGTYESNQPRAAPPASDVSFSSDGRSLASGYSEGKRAPWTVGLWEVASRRLISQLRGHQQPVVVAVFSADGKLLASGSWDKTVRLWDVASGRELACFEGHRGTVASLAFSPDAGRLASGSTDGTAIVWDIAGYPMPAASPAAPLGKSELDALWTDLRNDDAAKAYAASCKLAAAPQQAVPLLRQQLSLGLGDREIPRLIADLDSEQFDVREKASAELERLGTAAERPLREALSGRASAELRDRVARLLQKMRARQDEYPSGEQLREIRAVQVVERIANAEARELLRALADKGPTARLREEAKAALTRLAATRRT
jgi:hypothetical protein